jgi:hypothetical protein
VAQRLMSVTWLLLAVVLVVKMVAVVVRVDY